MGNWRDAYTVLVRRLKGNSPLGRPRVRWDDNIKKLFKKWNGQGRTAIPPAENRGRWRVLVKVVMSLPVEFMDWLRIVAGGG